MDKPEIRFGDKMFLYGQFLTHIDEFDEYNYNAVQGYMTVGGYNVTAKEAYEFSASVPGFIVEAFGLTGSLAFETPFPDLEVVDVTNKLAKSLPLPIGSKVWMPIVAQPQFHFQ